MKALNLFFLVFIICSCSMEKSSENTSSLELESGQIIDPLKLWTYEILNEGNGADTWTIKFERTQEVVDSSTGRLFKPGMTFQVFPLSNSNDPSETAQELALLSSCSYPNSGPVLYYAGGLVLWNSSTCNLCGTNGPNPIDYCSNIDRIIGLFPSSNYKTVQDWVESLPIKEKSS